MNSLAIPHWPGDPELIDYDDIPLARDLFLIGQNQMEQLAREWGRYLAGPGSPAAEHPNTLLLPRFAFLESRDSISCELCFEINMMDRWHEGLRVLPRDRVVACVHWWNYGKRPYLIVAQDWMDALESSLFSLTALVDVIGMRSSIRARGGVDADALNSLRERIDLIARDNPTYAFLSFADNVLVRSDWSAARHGARTAYAPESFIRVLEQVAIAIEESLHLRSYAVVSQGANWVVDPSGTKPPKQRNHLVFGSLGLPFVELFEIDKAVRRSIRRRQHPAADIYLSESLAISLRLKSSDFKESFRARLRPFESRTVRTDRRSYLPIDREELLPMLAD